MKKDNNRNCIDIMGIKMKDEDILQLTKGSKYTVKSLETRDQVLVTQGYFRGFTVIGNVDAIVIELDESHGEQKGKVRLIPSHMILSLDVISVAKAPENEKDRETLSKYFT